MQSTCISCILLLIHIISKVNGDIKRAPQGTNITLSCEVTGSDIKDKAKVNALWKKETGQRVIWRYSGVITTADTFHNRTFDINENLALVIDKCDKSDQGVYILCINGKPYCEVRLRVTERCKRSTEKLCDDKSTDPTQDLTDADEKNKDPQRTHGTIVGPIFLVVIPFVVVLFCGWFKRKITTKNDKSELGVLHPHTVIQIN